MNIKVGDVFRHAITKYEWRVKLADSHLTVFVGRDTDAVWEVATFDLERNLREYERVNPISTGTTRRREILAAVEACVCKDRQNTYGDAEDNFADIATLWNFWLKKSRGVDANLDARDVAMMSAMIKVARTATSPEHMDNWIDLAGYAVCGGGIVKSKLAKELDGIAAAVDHGEEELKK